MRPAPAEISRRRENHAGNRLAENTEHLAWLAHQRAVEIASDNPDSVAQALRRAATAEWRRTFLDLPE